MVPDKFATTLAGAERKTRTKIKTEKKGKKGVKGGTKVNQK
jgi:hypothetical protein